MSHEWTDLPGDPDIGSQYIMEAGHAQEDYERLLRERGWARFRDLIDRGRLTIPPDDSKGHL